VQKTAR
jgi:uncharacterized protein